MSHQPRREYLLSIHRRYRRADRKLKQVILNEFCANTEYNRKCAIRLLNGPPPSRVRPCQWRPRSPSYGPGVVSVLAGVWEVAAYPWSVRLKRRFYGRTKPGSLFKHQIPIKTDSRNVRAAGGRGPQ